MLDPLALDFATVDALERDCAVAWPPLEQRSRGSWLLRAAGGFTGRANSALVLGDQPPPLDEVRRFYAERELPARLQVVTGALIEAQLSRQGWRPDDDHCGPDGVAVLTGPLGGWPEDPTLPDAPAGNAVVHARPPRDWWPLAVGSAQPSAAARHVLTGYHPTGYAAIERDGSTVGVVRGALVGDLLHISRLAVDSRQRRAGLATMLLGALGDWAGARGARRCALQVTVTNHGAMALYTRLGCREHHRYRYWIPA